MTTRIKIKKMRLANTIKVAKPSCVMPTPMPIDEQEQLNRYKDFLNDINSIIADLVSLEDKMEKVNGKFRAEDKGLIFDADITAKVSAIAATLSYFKVSATGEQDKIYERKWRSIFERYKVDENFKARADALFEDVKDKTDG